MSTYFNDLKIDLNDEHLFPSDIYERTKNNPNPVVSYPCVQREDSPDAYASTLAQGILKSLNRIAMDAIKQDGATRDEAEEWEHIFGAVPIEFWH
jgi:hypothetical protein